MCIYVYTVYIYIECCFLTRNSSEILFMFGAVSKEALLRTLKEVQAVSSHAVCILRTQMGNWKGRFFV